MHPNPPPPPLHKIGLSPGTLVYAGPRPERAVNIDVMAYDAQQIVEHRGASLEECLRLRERGDVVWIDVDGVHDTDLVSAIGTAFGVHPLTLEDIVHTNQRPKLEEYPEYLYVVLKMLHYEHTHGEVSFEQVSLIIGEGFLLTFQEAREGDVFDPVRTRLREGRSRIRRAGADFLAYSLLDVIVDHYLYALEGIGEHIERVEDEVTQDPRPSVIRRINRLRREVLHLRRSVWPLRDVVAGLERSELPFMSRETDLYFRDLYDHTVRTVEIIESSREVLASMVEMHLSTLSFHMNEIMKVLAVISTFFLPLTFIAGIYGMNFNTERSPFNMPELNWYLGYPFALLLMALTAVGMYVYFRRKRWM